MLGEFYKNDKQEEVLGASTPSITLVSSQNPSYHNQNITYTITINPSNAEGISGYWIEIDGTIYNLSFNPTYVFTYSTSILNIGSHNIKAVYSHSAFPADFVASLVQVVSKNISITINQSSTSSIQGGNVTFSASLYSFIGGTPSGTIEFYDNNNLIGSQVLVGFPASASIDTTSLTQGNHTIKAKYLGGNGFDANEVTLSHSVSSPPVSSSSSSSSSGTSNNSSGNSSSSSGSHNTSSSSSSSSGEVAITKIPQSYIAASENLNPSSYSLISYPISYLQLASTSSNSILQDHPEIPLDGILVGITAASVVFVGSIASFSGSFAELFSLLVGYVVASRRKYWGIIFDENSNLPVPFASVILTKKTLNANGTITDNILASTVSDLEGRYRLNTDERDNFYLQIKASGYDPYYKFIKMDNPISIIEDIVYDIPLKRSGSNINYISKLLYYNKTFIMSLLRLFTLILSSFGFLLTLESIMIHQHIFYWILLLAYLGLLIYTLYPLIYRLFLKKGYVVDSVMKKQIPGVVVRVYKENKIKGISMSNHEGLVRFNLKPGDYDLLANKKGYQMCNDDNTKLGLDKLKVRNEGFLSKNIKMQKIEDSNTDIGDLDTPFG